MTAPSRGLLYVRCPNEEALERALSRGLEAEGYTPLESPVPPGYPRQTLEIKELYVSRWVEGWGQLVIEDLDQAFFWGRDLSRHNPSTPVAALYVERLGPFRLKLYVSGHPIVKLGRDPDDELFYPVAEAGPHELERAARTLKMARGTLEHLAETPSLPAVAAAFGLADIDADFRGLHASPARAAAHTYRCWVRTDSPLLDLA